MISFFDNSTIRLIGPTLPEGNYLGLLDCINYLELCACNKGEVSRVHMVDFLERMIREKYFQAFVEEVKIYPAEPEFDMIEIK